MILRELAVTSGNLFPNQPFEEVESRRKKVCSIASVNAPVDGKLFRYDPPSNYRVMAKLERAYPRAAKGLVGTRAPDLAMQTLTGEP